MFAEEISLGEIPWGDLNAAGQGVTNPKGQYQKFVDRAYETVDMFLGNIDAAPQEWDAIYANETRDAFMEVYRKLWNAAPHAMQDPWGALKWGLSPQLSMAALKVTVMSVVSSMNLLALADGRGEVTKAVEYGALSQAEAERTISMMYAGAETLKWLGAQGIFDHFLHKPLAEAAPKGAHGLGQEPVSTAGLIVIGIAGVLLAIIQGIVILGCVFLLVACIGIVVAIVNIEKLCEKMQARGASPKEISDYCIKPIASLVPNPADALKPLGDALNAVVWVAGILGGIFVLAKVAPDIVEAVKESRA